MSKPRSMDELPDIDRSFRFSADLAEILIPERTDDTQTMGSAAGGSPHDRLDADGGGATGPSISELT